MKNKKNKLKGEGLAALERLSREITGKVTFIEIHGDNELLLSGCKGIIDYDCFKIRADTLSGQVTITGTRLSLDVFRGDILSVTGKIADVRLGADDV